MATTALSRRLSTLAAPSPAAPDANARGAGSGVLDGNEGGDASSFQTAIVLEWLAENSAADNNVDPLVCLLSDRKVESVRRKSWR